MVTEWVVIVNKACHDKHHASKGHIKSLAQKGYNQTALIEFKDCIRAETKTDHS